MQRIIRNGNLETSYSPEDFVNPEYFEPHDSTQKAFIVLNGGYVLGIVFAEYPAYTDQDALDECADSGKLDGLAVLESELEDYEVNRYSAGYPEYEGICNLGNASECFADESLDVWILPASTFAEDSSLMTPERILYYLSARLDTTNLEWLRLYREIQDLEDSLTLARLTQGR